MKFTRFLASIFFLALVLAPIGPIPAQESPEPANILDIPAIMAALDTLLIVHPPVDAELVRVVYAWIGAVPSEENPNPKRSPKYVHGWVVRRGPEGVDYQTPFGSIRTCSAEQDGLDPEAREAAAPDCVEAVPETLGIEDDPWTTRHTGEHVDNRVLRATVAHWLWRRGESDLAARMVQVEVAQQGSAPAYMTELDDRLAHAAGIAMFDAFAALDYDLAENFGRQMLKNHPTTRFADWARQLLVELPERREDLTTFGIPTPEEWFTLQRILTRKEQIRYWCERLRLRRGSWYGSPPSESATPRIDPFVELLRGTKRVGEHEPRFGDPLGLRMADIPILAEYFTPSWYTLSRQGWECPHWPPRRTSELLAEVVNEVCETEVVDWDWPEGQTDQDYKTALLAWYEANKGFTAVERRRNRILSARKWSQVSGRDVEGIPAGEGRDIADFVWAFLDSADTDDAYDTVDVVEAALDLDCEYSLPRAVPTLGVSDTRARSEVAMAILSCDPANAAARDTLIGLLERRENIRTELCVRSLLQVGGPTAVRTMELAFAFLRDNEGEVTNEYWPTYMAVMRAGWMPAWEWSLAGLKNRTPQPTWSNADTCPDLRVCDYHANLLSLIRPDGMERFQLKESILKRDNRIQEFIRFADSKLAAIRDTN